MRNPEDVFEVALQRYEQAVREYKVAIASLIKDLGNAAAPVLENANNRICYLDATPGVASPVQVSQDEVERRAAMARPVIDAEPVAALMNGLRSTVGQRSQVSFDGGKTWFDAQAETS